MNENKFYSTIRKHYDYIFPLNSKQVEFVKSEFDDTNSKLIEIGCANGKLTNALSEYNIMGIDLEKEFVKEAKERYPEIEFATLNMLKVNTLNKKFDGIICFGNTLVHLDYNDIEDFTRKCYSSLNSDGKLLIQILNYDYILDNKIANLPIIDNEHVRFLRSYDFGKRLSFNTELTIKDGKQTISNSIMLTPVRKEEIVNMLESAGFSNIELFGSFGRIPLQENSLPLIISCKRK